MYIYMYQMKHKVKCYKSNCEHEWITKQQSLVISCSKCKGQLVWSKLKRLNLVSEVK